MMSASDVPPDEKTRYMQRNQDSFPTLQPSGDLCVKKAEAVGVKNHSEYDKSGKLHAQFALQPSIFPGSMCNLSSTFPSAGMHNLRTTTTLGLTIWYERLPLHAR